MCCPQNCGGVSVKPNKILCTWLYEYNSVVMILSCYSYYLKDSSFIFNVM